MTTTTKPTYEELANAFAEYLAMTSNFGEPPCIVQRRGGEVTIQLDPEEARIWENAIERAQVAVDAAGGSY